MTDNESDSSSEHGEQIRVAFTLAVECFDRSLEVPPHPISVPASITNKGLSVLLNHLMERSEEENQETPVIKFDFILGNNNRLLRTGVEREARRSGLSLEEAIPVTYFPAAKEPELQSQGEPLPDWISGVSFCTGMLVTASYDGSMQVHDTTSKSRLECVAQSGSVHSGAIKCLATVEKGDSCWIATGSMDHTLLVSRYKIAGGKKKHRIEQYASCIGGHASSIGSVDMFPTLDLASGDWDGGICIWDCKETPESTDQNTTTTKKIRTNDSKAQGTVTGASYSLAPKISIQAHASKVSGVSWGNFEKKRDSSPSHLISGSWDHSLKLWDIESRDCILTLNGSKVVSCLDTSHHSSGIVATGHPDCTVRLWDVRSADSKLSNMVISDKAFKPSHKEWITSVKWNPDNAYHLVSTSHDGSVKWWDIRSSLPLYTVRAFPKEQKGLCLSYGADGSVFAGGTDCVVKQFKPFLNEVKIHS